MKQATKTHLEFRSDQPERRPALTVVAFFLAITALFSIALVVASVFGLVNPRPYASLPLTTLIAGLVLLGYCGWYAVRLRNESRRQIVLRMEDSGVTLLVTEADDKRLSTYMSYSDIDYVEHFTPRDRETLVFHGRDGRIIEAPIWSKSRRAADLVQFLQDRNIKVMRV